MSHIDKTTSLRRQGSMAPFISNGCQLALACETTASVAVQVKASSSRTHVRDLTQYPLIKIPPFALQSLPPRRRGFGMTKAAMSSPEFAHHQPPLSSPEFAKRILRGSINQKDPSTALAYAHFAQDDTKKSPCHISAKAGIHFALFLIDARHALACAKRKEVAHPPLGFQGEQNE